MADLHLGYEFELVQAGLNLPSQTGKIKTNLVNLLDAAKPDNLLILGDLKHNIPGLSKQEWQDIPDFFEEISKRVKKIELIPGNHDGGISKFSAPGIHVESSRGLIIDNAEKTGFFHGHAWPSPKIFEAESWVIGHSHPAIQFRGLFGFRSVKSVWVKAAISRRPIVESFLKNRNVNFQGKDPEELMADMFNVKPVCNRIIIMPAFNELLGGLTLNTKAPNEFLGPILRGDSVDMMGAEIFLTDGTFLGKLLNLRRFG